jgi:hypothetical protein
VNDDNNAIATNRGKGEEAMRKVFMKMLLKMTERHSSFVSLGAELALHEQSKKTADHFHLDIYYEEDITTEKRGIPNGLWQATVLHWPYSREWLCGLSPREHILASSWLM